MNSTQSSPAGRPAVLILVLAALVVGGVGVGLRFVDRAAAVTEKPRAVLTALTHHEVGVEDGKIPEGVTVFGDHLPGISRLDPSLLAALQRAGRAASADGVDLFVNSGWRSRAYQAELFRQAVATYGSEEAALSWAARPGTSVHEKGKAADIGPLAADDWLIQRGAAFGLCQTYANEPWHFELRPGAVTSGCPQPYGDPTDAARAGR